MEPRSRRHAETARDYEKGHRCSLHPIEKKEEGDGTDGVRFEVYRSGGAVSGVGAWLGEMEGGLFNWAGSAGLAGLDRSAGPVTVRGGALSGLQAVWALS